MFERPTKNLAAGKCLSASVLAIAVFSFGQPIAATQQAPELPQFEKTATEVASNADEALKQADTILYKIAQLPDGELSFRSVFVALDDAENVVAKSRNRHNFLAGAHPDKELRDAGDSAYQKAREWAVRTYTRDDLYRQVKTYAESNDPRITAEWQGLSPTDRRLVERFKRQFLRNGVALTANQRAEVIALQKQLEDLQIQFGQNFQADEWVVFTQDEFAGLPAEIRQRYRFADGVFHVRTTASDVVAIYKNSPLEPTRRKAMTARYRRAFSTNVGVSTNILRSRFNLGQLLGYKSWAEYKIEPGMMGTPQRANETLDLVNGGLDTLFRDDLAALGRIARSADPESGGRVNAWDIDFYTSRRMKAEIDFDIGSLRQYFEYDQVLEGLLETCMKVFGVQFEPLEVPDAWHPDVSALSVKDKSSGRRLGVLFLDLRTRDGKRDSFSEWQIVPSKQLGKDSQMPVAVLLGNVPKPSGTAPALLDFRDVEILFHEMGHALHELLGQTQYSVFSGTNVERDFVESPSIMMESFASDPGVLNLIAPARAGGPGPLPTDLIPKLKLSRAYEARVYDKRQVALAQMDLDLHLTNEVVWGRFNATAYADRAFSEFFLPSPPGTSFINTFTHIMEGGGSGLRRPVLLVRLGGRSCGRFGIGFRGQPQRFFG